MHLFDQRLLGIIILLLLGMLVIVKRITTGSILDKPNGDLMIQLVNIFNLFFLLVINPFAAILLITGNVTTIDPTHLVIPESGLLKVFEAVALVFYVIGYLMMAWSLITLKRNYQLGGIAPRSTDTIVTTGPYRLVRHPMYAAALSIALGLACSIQSWGFLSLFFIYLLLIFLLIPVEENALRKKYGEQYRLYKLRTRKLITLIY